MEKTKKITKREHFNTLLTIPAVAEDEALTAFIQHELELLDRKNSGDKKPTATQVANDALKEDILANMQDNRLYAVGEMIKEFDCCAGLSTPKVSALVTQMYKAGLLERVEEKRRAYFRKVVG